MQHARGVDATILNIIGYTTANIFHIPFLLIYFIYYSQHANGIASIYILTWLRVESQMLLSMSGTNKPRSSCSHQFQHQCWDQLNKVPVRLTGKIIKEITVSPSMYQNNMNASKWFSFFLFFSGNLIFMIVCFQGTATRYAWPQPSQLKFKCLIGICLSPHYLGAYGRQMMHHLCIIIQSAGDDASPSIPHEKSFQQI